MGCAYFHYKSNAEKPFLSQGFEVKGALLVCTLNFLVVWKYAIYLNSACGSFVAQIWATFKVYDTSTAISGTFADFAHLAV